MATIKELNEAISTLLGGTMKAEEFATELRKLANNYAQNFIMLESDACGEPQNVCFHLELMNAAIENIENAIENEGLIKPQATRENNNQC